MVFAWSNLAGRNETTVFTVGFLVGRLLFIWPTELVLVGPDLLVGLAFLLFAVNWGRANEGIGVFDGL